MFTLRRRGAEGGGKAYDASCIAGKCEHDTHT